MFNVKKLLTIIFLILVLCGCNNAKSFESFDIQNPVIEHIEVDNKKITIKEILKGINDTFNNVLYYHGDDDTSAYLTSNKNLFLNNELEVELYFESNSNTGEKAFVYPPKIYLVITNIAHPLSSEDTTKLYEFGIEITEFGMRSDFYYQGHSISKEKYNFLKDDMVYLGQYTMLLEDVVKPNFEEMDDTWKKNVASAIKLYMDNNFYSETEKNLAAGEYKVYVQSFFKSDNDTKIIFEHENGKIYVGNYYFVHEIAPNKPADLNKVVLSDDNTEAFKKYLEKVRSNSAVTVEYFVDGL